MKMLKVIISLIVTIALVYALNRSWGAVPPIAKFLDPFHGFWQNAERDVSIPEALNIPGLKDPVKIIYDSMMIPHIFANNNEDLYFAQGYVTASMRLWQMETQIRSGKGRLAEILGPALLERDRSQRRLGMVYAAENSLHVMEKDPETLSAVTSYTAGVNAYIATLNPETLPLEYKILNYQPEPWSNLDCAMLLKNMAATLNMGEKDKEMTRALAKLGKPTLDLLWPDNENVGDPIVDRTNNWKFKSIIKLDTIPMAIPDGLIEVPAHKLGNKDVGSNNWVVSGSKTATGSPILCNDPHLNLSLPSIWFAIHLNAPGMNVMGSSLPGAPSIIIGFNDSIAWGVTNAQRDLVDFYKIQFKDKSMNEYRSDGAWKPSRKVIEKILVKGQEPFFDTVTYTHQGPIVYDMSFHGMDMDNLYAFRWLAHDGSNELRTFYELNHSRNYIDFMKALDHFQTPAQNFVFASTAGDIAIRVQGKFPVRRKDEGKFILDGTKTSQEWKAFIPNDQNVMDKNPVRGFASSANQYPADATYPYYINADSYEAYRNRRINQVLTSLTKATVEDMMKLQQDSYNLKAAESLPYFLSNLDSTSLNESEKKAWQLLKSWDYNNTVDSEAASYYEAWWDSLVPLIWDELRDNDEYYIGPPTTFTTIKLLKEQPALSFFDMKSTNEIETAKDILRKSFKLGVDAVETWKKERSQDPKWADYKGTVIRHLMQLDPLSVHVRTAGNHDIVNATTRTHGPSWRMIVSLEKSGVKAWGVYPGGQSGNTGSPYYANMISMWATGKYVPLQFSPAEVLTSSALGTTTLQPVSK